MSCVKSQIELIENRSSRQHIFVEEKKMFGIICVQLLLILYKVNAYCNTPTVRMTANGPIEGIVQISSLGQKYYSFRGIPFAAPPITGKDPYTGQQVDRRFKV